MNLVWGIVRDPTFFTFKVDYELENSICGRKSGPYFQNSNLKKANSFSRASL